MSENNKKSNEENKPNDECTGCRKIAFYAALIIAGGIFLKTCMFGGIEKRLDNLNSELEQTNNMLRHTNEELRQIRETYQHNPQKYDK